MADSPEFARARDALGVSADDHARADALSSAASASLSSSSSSDHPSPSFFEGFALRGIHVLRIHPGLTVPPSLTDSTRPPPAALRRRRRGPGRRDRLHRCHLRRPKPQGLGRHARRLPRPLSSRYRVSLVVWGLPPWTHAVGFVDLERRLAQKTAEPIDGASNSNCPNRTWACTVASAALPMQCLNDVRNVDTDLLLDARDGGRGAGWVDQDVGGPECVMSSTARLLLALAKRQTMLLYRHGESEC